MSTPIRRRAAVGMFGAAGIVAFAVGQCAPGRAGDSGPVALVARPMPATEASTATAPPPPAAVAPPPAPSARALERPTGASPADAIAATNTHRRAAGVPELAVHAALDRVALAHSIDQAAMRSMTHTGSDGSNAGERLARVGSGWGVWGENVAAGYATVTAVVDGWMGSPGHRGTILDATFTHVGVASAEADDGTRYWTMVLAG